MSDNTPVRGRLRPEWWVHCGKCGRSEYADGVTKSMAARDAIARLGFKRSQPFGWLCPYCAALNAAEAGTAGTTGSRETADDSDE